MRRLALVGLLACKHGEEVGTISGPPLLIDRDAIAEAAAPPSTDDASVAEVVPPPPLVAKFSWVDARAVDVGGENDACVQTLFVGVSGKVVVKSGITSALGPGDALVLQGRSQYQAEGAGTFVLATVTAATCEPAAKPRLFRAAAVKPLTWAGGAMHATLLVEKDDAKFAYVGLLEGTSPVVEHVHEGSWEVLCAITAAGDFTLAGRKSRLAPKSCVTVPPNTKHSWAPDPGSTLSAVQFYVPAGPEQRFRGLAAAEADAGVPKGDGGK